MRRRTSLDRITDTEGVTHFHGAAQAVNAALCGANDDMRPAEGPVDCLACIATLKHVYGHSKPPEVA